MDSIKLFDSTTFNIEDGASLNHIVHTAKSAAKAKAIADKITEENLTHVEFYHEDLLVGIYDNLGLTDPGEDLTNPVVDGKVVTISLYQK